MIHWRHFVLAAVMVFACARGNGEHQKKIGRSVRESSKEAAVLSSEEKQFLKAFNQFKKENAKLGGEDSYLLRYGELFFAPLARKQIDRANRSVRLQRLILNLLHLDWPDNKAALEMVFHSDAFSVEFSKSVREVLKQKLKSYPYTKRDDVAEEGLMLWVLQKHGEPFSNVRKYFSRHFNSKGVDRNRDYAWARFSKLVTHPYGIHALKGYGQRANVFAAEFVRAMDYDVSTLNLLTNISSTMKAIDPMGNASASYVRTRISETLDYFKRNPENSKHNREEFRKLLARTGFSNRLREISPRHSTRIEISKGLWKLSKLNVGDAFPIRWEAQQFDHDTKRRKGKVSRTNEPHSNFPGKSKREHLDKSLPKRGLKKRPEQLRPISLSKKLKFESAAILGLFDFGGMDPNGLVWSPVMRVHPKLLRTMNIGQKHGVIVLPDNSVLMTYKMAKQYCRRLGGRLPSRTEFVRLRELLGAQGQDLTNYQPRGALFLNRRADQLVWSSSVLDENQTHAYRFLANRGTIGTSRRDAFLNVMCVFQ